MKQEEINKLVNEIYNSYISYDYTRINNSIEQLREDIRKEREDLRMRAVNAETKLKLYEGLFNRLNLNLEIGNEESDA